MLNDNPASGAAEQGADPEARPLPEADSSEFDDSLINELATLIDDGRTYA